MDLSHRKFNVAKAAFKKPQLAVLSALTLIPLTVASTSAASAATSEGATFEFTNKVIVKNSAGGEDPNVLEKISQYKDFVYDWDCILPDKTKLTDTFYLEKGARTNNSYRLQTGSKCTITENGGAKNYLDNTYAYELELVTDTGTTSTIKRSKANKFEFTISQAGLNEFVLKNVYTPKPATDSMKNPPAPAPEQPKQGSKPAPRDPNNSEQPKNSMPQKNQGSRFSLAWILAPLALLLAAIGAGYLHWFHR